MFNANWKWLILDGEGSLIALIKVPESVIIIFSSFSEVSLISKLLRMKYNSQFLHVNEN